MSANRTSAPRLELARIVRAPAIWLRYLALVVVAIIPYGLHSSDIAYNLHYFAIGCSSVVALALGVWLHRPVYKLPWLLILTAQVLVVSGDAVWLYYALFLHTEAPSPSIADLLYFAGYLPLFLGIILLVRQRTRGNDQGGLIDAAIITIGLGLVGWVFLMAPYAYAADLTLSERLISLAYPLIDVLLVAVLVQFLLSPGRRPPAFVFLSLSYLMQLAADIVSALMTLNAGYSTGNPVDYGWLLSFALLGTAALHPSMRLLAEATPERRSLTGLRIILLALASLLAPGVLVLQYLRGAILDVPVIAVCSILLFLLPLVRMYRLVRELRVALQKREEAESQLTFQAFHDPLTRLPNRALFNDRLYQSLARAARRQQALAVLFADLDGFKAVNDTLGHDAGDTLLRTVADRLRNALRVEDTIARMGGDEFTMILEQLPDPQTATWVAERFIRDLRAPMTIAGRNVTVSASVGIAWSSAGQEKAEDLVRAADVAMYRAKQSGKNQTVLFDERMDASRLNRLDLEAELRRALEQRELFLVYQPIIDLSSGQPVGLEALLRWRHPERGLIPPSDFIPVAEETGQIAGIGRWVLETACRQAKRWQDAGLPPVRIAVNLSARQLKQKNLVDVVARVLRDSELDPTCLELELTEWSIMEQAETTIGLLQELTALGIRLSVDDFGTGYSSLAYLKRFPINTLKVAQVFVRDIPGDANDAAITASVISLAHSLRLAVIAEGVETAEQLVFLRQQGCDMVQGYLFCRPQDAETLTPLLQRGFDIPVAG